MCQNSTINTQNNAGCKNIVNVPGAKGVVSKGRLLLSMLAVTARGRAPFEQVFGERHVQPRPDLKTILRFLGECTLLLAPRALSY
jgi:hypothetical protein